MIDRCSPPSNGMESSNKIRLIYPTEFYTVTVSRGMHTHGGIQYVRTYPLWSVHASAGADDAGVDQ
jgi:hypothetical protein